MTIGSELMIEVAMGEENAFFLPGQAAGVEGKLREGLVEEER